MLMVSIRHNFWDASSLAPALSWGRLVQENFQTTLFSTNEVNAALQGLKGKRVLVLIHGYNENEQATVNTYFKVSSNIQKWVIDATTLRCFYDAIVGFVWPGYAHGFDYFFAKKNARTGAHFLKEFFIQLSADAAQIDTFCHSMGNLLFLEALEYAQATVSNPLIHTFYSLAPAVNQDSIDRQHIFFPSTLNFSEMNAFYSNHDPIEKWIYPIAEHAQALGEAGDEYPLNLPSNVQLIDCSSLVHSHSEYFDLLAVYSWIKQRKNGEIAGPEKIQDVELLNDGTVYIKRLRTHIESVS